jgi:succinyl-diaminopimelate desuccinylase
MVNSERFYKDLDKLISFKTVAAPKKDGCPFGKQNALALEFFLNVAKDLGFETINYDNYAGEVYFGEGQEIGIIGHLDVVPEGDGWDTDPYKLTEKDGYLFGRGVMDDKLPTLLILYALKELKDSGVKINKKFYFFNKMVRLSYICSIM